MLSTEIKAPEGVESIRTVLAPLFVALAATAFRLASRFGGVGLGTSFCTDCVACFVAPPSAEPTLAPKVPTALVVMAYSTAACACMRSGHIANVATRTSTQRREYGFIGFHLCLAFADVRSSRLMKKP